MNREFCKLNNRHLFCLQHVHKFATRCLRRRFLNSEKEDQTPSIVLPTTPQLPLRKVLLAKVSERYYFIYVVQYGASPKKNLFEDLFQILAFASVLENYGTSYVIKLQAYHSRLRCGQYQGKKKRVRCTIHEINGNDVVSMCCINNMHIIIIV